MAAIPAPPTGSADLWSTGVLVEAAFKGVPFPTTSFDVTLRHDLAEHRYADRDGASVEATGRAPLQFRAHIPFRNGVSHGASESWPSGRLYPEHFIAFLGVAADRSTGVLQHPALGYFNCKTVSVHTTWAAEPRDGVDVDVEWLETIDPSKDFAVTSQPPLTVATRAAANLDSNLTVAAPSFPASPIFTPSFADQMRQIQAIGDSVSVLEQRVGGQIDSIAYRVDQIKESANRAGVAFWPLRQDAERMADAVQRLRKDLLKSKRAIGFYFVPKPMTLAAIACAAGAKVEDVMSLNPDLIRDPIVQPRTAVRFYST